MKKIMVAAAVAVALFSTQVAMAGAFQNKVSSAASNRTRTVQSKHDKMELRGDMKMQKSSKSAVTR